MKKIKVIPIIKGAFSCVFHYPGVLIPFLVYYSLCALVFAWIFHRFYRIFTVSSTAFLPFEEFFSVVNFFFIAIGVMILLLLLFPLVEGWMFAILKTVLMNEPIDMRGTLKKGIQRYLGMVVINFILLAASSVASMVGSILLFASMISKLPSFIPVTGEPLSQPSIFMFPEFFIIYAVMVIIMLLIYTIFIYLKPVYIIGDSPLSQSIKDGITIGKKQFIPTFLLLLFFMAIQIAIFAGIMSVAGVTQIMDMDLLAHSDPFQVFQPASHLIATGIIVYLISFMINGVMYAAIARAYVDVQEMIEGQ